MRGICTTTTTLAPAVAASSAVATLACCLPWGIGAALGALGLSAFVERFQAEFIALSVILLGIGLAQIVRLRRSCKRRSRVEIAVWGIAAAIIVAVVVFPEWVAGLLAALHR
jgi:hypothetical protein